MTLHGFVKITQLFHLASHYPVLIFVFIFNFTDFSFVSFLEYLYSSVYSKYFGKSVTLKIITSLQKIFMALARDPYPWTQLLTWPAPLELGTLVLFLYWI